MPCGGCGDSCKCSTSQCCQSCKCDSSCSCAGKKADSGHGHCGSGDAPKTTKK